VIWCIWIKYTPSPPLPKTKDYYWWMVELVIASTEVRSEISINYTRWMRVLNQTALGSRIVTSMGGTNCLYASLFNTDCTNNNIIVYGVTKLKWSCTGTDDALSPCLLKVDTYTLVIDRAFQLCVSFNFGGLIHSFICDISDDLSLSILCIFISVGYERFLYSDIPDNPKSIYHIINWG
jgi:hypothetical protein